MKVINALPLVAIGLIVSSDYTVSAMKRNRDLEAYCANARGQQRVEQEKREAEAQREQALYELTTTQHGRDVADRQRNQNQRIKEEQRRQVEEDRRQNTEERDRRIAEIRALQLGPVAQPVPAPRPAPVHYVVPRPAPVHYVAPRPDFEDLVKNDRNSDAIRTLIAQGHRPTVRHIFSVIEYGCVEIIKIFIEAGFFRTTDRDTTNFENNTALAVATSSGQIAMVKYLVENGAAEHINAPINRFFTTTPIQKAKDIINLYSEGERLPYGKTVDDYQEIVNFLRSIQQALTS